MGGMATMLLCTLLFSCNHEELLDNEQPLRADKSISFGLSSGQRAQTRSHTDKAEKGYTAHRFVLRSDHSADTLCARVIVSDGIYLSDFEESPALTRAVPVTTDSFYDKFHVAACRKEGGVADTDRFFMDEDATRNGSNIWNTDKTYYWPGADHSFRFYAWAPTDAAGLALPTSPQSMQMSYTVPADVAAQKDIVTAVTDEIAGNYNASVPLSFRHICTAVRFVVGEIQAGTVKRVALKGVRNAGTYDMAAASWTLAETTADYSQTLDKAMSGTEAAGTAITTAEGTFMMLPQTLPSGAEVEVVFSPTVGEERTLTATIGGTAWPMGNTVTYRLTITPEYELEFVSEPEVQDAHYEICTVNVKATNVSDEDEWVLEAVASDGAEVSVQMEADVNQFAKEGFWTDKVIENNQITATSARGTNSLVGKGSGEYEIYLFLPENSGNSDRTVTLSLKMKGAARDLATLSIVQKCPADGWEQIDDSETGEYGFNWNRKVAYIFPYNLGAGLVTQYTEKQANELINNIITQHNATDYASINEYNPSRVTTRVYVLIEYEKLNIVSAESSDDGHGNTLELYRKAGSAATGEFEQALLNTYKTEAGHTDEHMFRLPDDSSDNRDPLAVPRPSGENNPQSGILNYILKKNRYYLLKTETSIGTTIATTTSPYIKEEDIVWYLPAYGEFNTLPSDIISPIRSSDCWSSTANNTANTEAYLGDGSSVTRNTVKYVRAKRKEP